MKTQLQHRILLFATIVLSLSSFSIQAQYFADPILVTDATQMYYWEDLNNDGLDDYIYAQDGDIYVGYNNYPNGFTDEFLILSNPEIQSIQLHDQHHDGDIDIFYLTNSELYYLSNGGFGNLTAPILQGPLFDDNSELAFLNDDAIIDIWTHVQSGPNNLIEQRYFNGDGTHSDPPILNLPVSLSPQGDYLYASAVPVDMNSDGYCDFISAWAQCIGVCMQWEIHSAINVNQGDGTFSFLELEIGAPYGVPVEYFPVDIDMDGIQDDLLATGWWFDSSEIFYGGENNFTTPTMYPAYVIGTGAPGDWDGDGIADRYARPYGEDELQVELSYLSEDEFFLFPYIGQFTPQSADINGDGLDELLRFDESEQVYYMYSALVFGCNDEAACNFDPSAILGDDSCCYGVCGCTDPLAANYDPNTECEVECSYIISGYVFFDDNANGVMDIDEFGLSNFLVELESAGVAIFTDPDGYFEFSEPSLAGAQLTVQAPDGSAFTVETFDDPYVIPDDFLGEPLFLGMLNQYAVGPEINFTLHNLSGEFICDANSQFLLSIQNVGEVPLEGVMEITIPEEFTSFELDEDAYQQNMNTYSVFFPEITPGGVYHYTFHTGFPGVDFMGQWFTVSCQTTAYSVWNPNLSEIATDDHSNELVCAYDPNEIVVNPEGETDQLYLGSGQRVEYTIHFQNTGTAPANLVTIVDSIPSGIDISSISIDAYSHPMSAEIDLSDNAITFTFQDINLPDSTCCFDESMGFVSFSATLGNEHLLHIPQRAFIYFDENPPIITNTLDNHLYNCAEDFSFEIFNDEFPNCPGDSIQVIANSESGYITNWVFTLDDTYLGEGADLYFPLPLLPPEHDDILELEVYPQGELCSSELFQSSTIVASEALPAFNAEPFSTLLVCSQSEVTLPTGNGLDLQFDGFEIEETVFFAQDTLLSGTLSSEGFNCPLHFETEVLVLDNNSAFEIPEQWFICSSTGENGLVPPPWEIATEVENLPEGVSWNELNSAYLYSSAYENAEGNSPYVIDVYPLFENEGCENFHYEVEMHIDLTPLAVGTFYISHHQGCAYTEGELSISTLHDVTWNDEVTGLTFPFTYGTSPDTVIAVISDGGTCPVTREYYLLPYDAPSVELFPVDPICAGESTNIGAYLYDVSYFEWQGQLAYENEFDVVVNSDSTFIIYAENFNGCSISDSVTVSPTSVLLSVPDTVATCIGDEAVLNVESNGEVLWNDSETGPEFSFLPEESQYVHIYSDLLGECGTTDSIWVNLNPLPLILITDDQEVCQGEVVMLEASVNDQTIWEFEFTPDNSETFDVSFTDDNGCSSTVFTTVEVLPVPEADFTQDGFILTATAGTAYQWYLDGNIIPGATGQTYEVLESGNYSVQVFNVEGCHSTSASLFVLYVGLEERESLSFQVFPNPTHDLTIVELDQPCPECLVRLLDMHGKLIEEMPMTGKRIEIASDYLSAGNYLIQVIKGNSLQTVILIIE